MTSIPWYLFWGAVSTVFFVYILFLVGNLIASSRAGMPQKAHNLVGKIWWLLLISWTLYPLAYLVPLGLQLFPEWGAWAAVTRQFLYTMADIFSKVIYGVLLANVAQVLSAAEGFQPALDLPQNHVPAEQAREYVEHYRR
jgi:bacteriorhodopsin